MKATHTLLSLACAWLMASATMAQEQTLAPTDHGRALVNPDMGWTMHFYSNVPTNYGSQLEPEDVLDDFPGLSTVYLRLPWAFIEPEKGQFNWEWLDTPAQRWISVGKKVALRITATENWTLSGTPEWVFQAGARYHEVDHYKEPEYDDGIFLSAVEHFVSEMARRYDGNPNVAFIDIGHFGMWGEGHTEVTTPRHHISWGFETQKRIIDIYCKYFKHTQLVISDDFAGHDRPGLHFPIIDYALSRGVSLRDDSILVQPAPRSWFHSEMASLFWPTMPVVLEHEHYGGSVARGAWDKELLLRAVEEYHASYLSIHWWPRIELDENRDIIDRINRRMGYRIQLSEVRWPQTVRKGQPFRLCARWRNAGVAPCYPGGHPCFTLKNEKGGIVSVLVDAGLDVRNLPVAGPEETAPACERDTSFIVARPMENSFGTFTRSCKPGRYQIYFSVGTLDGTPTLQLPYEGDDGQKRYLMGDITLTE